MGGGFVVDESATGTDRIKPADTPVPLPFGSASELLLRAYETGLPISGVMLANEVARRSESEVRAGLLRIWAVLRLLRSLVEESPDVDPLHIMDWVNLFALAVNEENASISGAEVGSQGEVGSACSMAAAGLTEALGGQGDQCGAQGACAATARMWSRSTRSSRRCARPVPT